MSKFLEKKKQIVSEIATKFRDSQSTVLVDYRGLDVAEVTELRKQLREAGVEYKVYKNLTSLPQLQKLNFTELDELLVGPTAIAFSDNDVIAPAKILNKFAKEHKDLEIKGGVIEGKVASLDQIKELADLPNYEGLLSMLPSPSSTCSQLRLSAKAIAEQKKKARSLIRFK